MGIYRVLAQVSNVNMKTRLHEFSEQQEREKLCSNIAKVEPDLSRLGQIFASSRQSYFIRTAIIFQIKLNIKYALCAEKGASMRSIVKIQVILN